MGTHCIKPNDAIIGIKISGWLLSRKYKHRSDSMWGISSNNLRKNLNKLPCSLFTFFLKLLDQQCWRFSEGYLNNFSTELSYQIFDCCPRNFSIQEKQNGNVVSNSHWIRPVFIFPWKQPSTDFNPYDHKLPCSLFKFFLKLLDQQCWRFSEGYLNNFCQAVISDFWLLS